MLFFTEKKIKGVECMEISCTNKWNEKDTDVMSNCILIQIRNRLEQLKKESKIIVIIWGSRKGYTPPWNYLLKIASFMIGIKPIIDTVVSHNIILCLNKDQHFWMSKILEIYKPVKPVLLAQDENDIYKLLDKNILTNI